MFVFPKKMWFSKQSEFNSFSFEYCSIREWGTGTLISDFEYRD